MLKITNFPYTPLSFRAVGLGDPVRISGTALRILKPESLR